MKTKSWPTALAPGLIGAAVALITYHVFGLSSWLSFSTGLGVGLLILLLQHRLAKRRSTKRR